VGRTGKKKKKAFIRTVKRNFLTNNINHMLCIYNESRVGSVKKYRERLYTFSKHQTSSQRNYKRQAAIFTTQAPTEISEKKRK